MVTMRVYAGGVVGGRERETQALVEATFGTTEARVVTAAVTTDSA